MKTSHANRGMALESLIEHANAQYAAKGIATIQKVATPWKVIRNGNQIVSAFPEKKSTVDFIGVFGGKPIAFDAKSTLLKSRIPYSNFEKHQIEFMESWVRNGGTAFFIVEFAVHNERYLLTFSQWMSHETWTGESITYNWFTNNCSRIESANGIVLDYLKEVTA